jgi:hypothetical protein
MMQQNIDDDDDVLHNRVREMHKKPRKKAHAQICYKPHCLSEAQPIYNLLITCNNTQNLRVSNKQVAPIDLFASFGTEAV